MPDDVALSIVVPLFDEAPIVKELVARCLQAAEQCARSFELILIDDASRDDTPREIEACRGPHVRSQRLAANAGQFRATQAGLSMTRGALVVVLDGDLQDPPEDIPRLVHEIDATPVDVVFAVKERRDDPAWVTVGAWAYHGMQRGLGGGRLPRGAGSFCVMRRDAARRVCDVSVERINLAAVLGSFDLSFASIPYEKRGRYDASSRVGAVGLVREALASVVLSGALHRAGAIATVAFSVGALAATPVPPVRRVLAGVALASAGVGVGAWLLHRRWRRQRTR